MGLAEFRARRDVQVLGQPGVDGVVDGQRLCPVARGGQGQDEAGVQRLVQRVEGDGLPEQSDHALRPCAAQRHVGGLGHGVQVRTVHTAEHRMAAHLLRDARGDRPPPEGQGVREQLQRRVESTTVGGLTGPVREVAVAQQIHRVRRHQQPVAARLAEQQAARRPGRQLRLQQPPQQADVPVDHVHGGGRRPLRPQDVDDLAQPQVFPGPYQEQAQQRPLLGNPQVQLGRGPPGAHRPQDLEPQELTCRGHRSPRAPRFHSSFTARTYALHTRPRTVPEEDCVVYKNAPVGGN
nr:hypothetical protein [Streptomyces sp. RTd22]